MSYRWRWEFRRYDHRHQWGGTYSRGWLHYVGLPWALLVIGFHRGVVGGYGYNSRENGKPQAWLEFTFYSRLFSHAIYPGVRIPRRWL